MLIRSNIRLSLQGNRGMYDKHQLIEEPCNGKLLRTVLKTSGSGDWLTEFNPADAGYQTFDFLLGFKFYYELFIFWSSHRSRHHKQGFNRLEERLPAKVGLKKSWLLK